jgi:branched-chain amino acid transport system ATP-binding protein
MQISPLLETRSVGVAHGEIQVLWDASITVNPGEIVCLLGPNGSGKSTLMNSISGLNKVVSGEIRFEGQLLNKLPAHKINQVGLSHVLERHRLFPYMTVFENLILGAGRRPSPAFLKSRFDLVYDLFPRLRERNQQVAKSMSGGEQQMCAIGRGLMGSPKMLMVDEPFIGLSPRFREEVTKALARLNRESLAILLIEQNVKQALELSHRAYILRAGHIVVSGPSSTLVKDSRLAEIFFGRDISVV